MKKINLLFIAVASTMFSYQTAISQCTVPTVNTGVDLQGVSISPIDLTVPVGGRTTVEVVLNSNIGGTSLFIPTDNARATISIPTGVAKFGSPLNFVCDPVGLFVVSSASLTALAADPTLNTIQIRNSGGNFLAGTGAIITFTIEGIGIGGSDNNLVLNSSLSGTSNCGDIFGTNQSATGRIDVTPAVAPVTLISFNAVKDGNNGKLSWVSATEQNASHYDVEHSTDGRTWSKVGKVQAKGNTTSNSNYSFTHNGLATGDNFYRLQSVDNDGKAKQSNIAKLKVNSSSINSMSVFPNPAKDFTNISYSNEYRGKAQVVVTDAAGKRLSTAQTMVNAGENIMKLSTTNLKAGTYVITMYAEDGTKLGAPQRLLVNN